MFTQQEKKHNLKFGQWIQLGQTIQSSIQIIPALGERIVGQIINIWLSCWQMWAKLKIYHLKFGQWIQLGQTIQSAIQMIVALKERIKWSEN